MPKILSREAKRSLKKSKTENLGNFKTLVKILLKSSNMIDIGLFTVVLIRLKKLVMYSGQTCPNSALQLKQKSLLILKLRKITLSLFYMHYNLITYYSTNVDE